MLSIGVWLTACAPFLVESKVFDDIDLFHYDKSHPSREGSYLGACVYFATIFKKEVEFSYIDPYLNMSTQTYLREKASWVVMNELGRWNNAK